jgi:hypothetical protein
MLRADIRVKGQIDAHWSEWFEGLEVVHTVRGETVLSGDVADQAALYGLLAKLRDLGLLLISVESSEIVDGPGSGSEADEEDSG